MKLSTLHEGYWKVVKSHPGGLGGSGRADLFGKENLSFMIGNRHKWLSKMQPLSKNAKNI